MANEFLTRIPTSTGNQKVFTYSCWIKRNKITDWMRLLSITNNNNDAIIQLTNVDKLRFRDEVTSPDVDYISSRALRDVGSWMHVLVAIDTTATQSEHRIRMYINGDSLIEHGLDTESMPGDRNLDLQFNDSGLEHRFFARNNDTEYFLGEAFDLFWVDGQALTPDVFGFNKDGDGYISVGSTQATDFRPGQWVPKSPRTIKSEINRRGGFGVNGFYLPMNDSSNFGADFHMTPNSIIKLKGEDLPQPRNGAPTTTDAYVSQLRTDPYAANLVLAVPGISTATGSNLVTNGTFDTNTTGWTAGNSATLSVDSGRLKVTNGTSSAGYAYQAITVEVGKRYTVNLEGITGTSASNVRIGTAANSAAYGNKIGSGLVNISLTSTSTTLYVTLKPNSNTNGNNALFDNIVVKQEDAPRDYSADIKGSGSNKTLTPAGSTGVGYELGNYYGSAMNFPGNSTSSLATPSNSDFAFGTGDFTVEFWVKASTQHSYHQIFDTRGTIGNSTTGFSIGYTSGNFYIYTNTFNIQRSVSLDQFVHIAAEREGSNLTLYINGVAVGFQNNFNLNLTNSIIYIGATGTGDTTQYFKGQVQDLRVYKGVAKYKGGFDVPKPYTPVGFEGESWRQVPDNCKNNFPVISPLAGNGTLTDGNLTFTAGGIQSRNSTFATTGNGKWYAEFRTGNVQSGTWEVLGIHPINKSAGPDRAYAANGQFWNGSAWVNFGTAWSNGDIIGIAYNQDDNEISFYLNGTLQGSTQSYSSSESHYFVVRGNSGSIFNCNFGQNPTFSGNTTAGTYTDSNGKGLFKYQPPSGFLALCEDNLPAPAIANPGEHFKTVLYTGNGSARGITGVGFKPDFVWIKNRDSTYQHQVYDSVRGAGQKLLPSNTNAESTDTANVSSFDSNGFSFAGGNVGVNQDTKNHVAWCWKAGGAAVTNTDGTITSQVSANQTAGFSIVSYTGNQTSGATVGHGLNKTPKWFIVKERGNANNWTVYHHSIGNTRVLYLDLANDQGGAFTGAWNNTSPTSSVFSLGNSVETNRSSGNYIAYCWAEIEGYSKFGTYEANGNTDGPFVYCGFKPAWVMIKRTSGSDQWVIYDSSRNSSNPAELILRPNLNFTENTEPGAQVDLLSNGFKLRGSGGGIGQTNQSGETYIFIAFAESPFQTANAK